MIFNKILSLVHGIVLVVSGVAVIALKTSNNPNNFHQHELLLGILIPFGTAVAIGWKPIFANIGFAEGTSLLVGLVVKSIATASRFGSYF